MADVKTVVEIADMAWDIVLKKQAEDNLQESVNRYRTLFESANDTIFIIFGCAMIL